MTGIWKSSFLKDRHELTVRFLAAEEAIIYLLAYSVLHRATLPRPWQLILKCLITNQPIDWATLYERVKEYRLRVPVVMVLLIW